MRIRVINNGTEAFHATRTMKVLIVGCGLSGLAAALSLVKEEDVHEITIVERRADLESRGATFGLQINGQHALNEIAGVGNDTEEACPMVKRLQNEGLLIPASGGYMLPWWKVRDALLDEVKTRMDKIKIYLGVSLDEVVEKNDGSYLATFKDSNLQLTANLLIGADGVNSVVRRDVLKLPPAKPSGVYVWRGSIDTLLCQELKQLQEIGIAKMTKLGDTMFMSYFNFHSSVPGQVAWVFSVRANMLSDHIKIECGTTSPIDVIKAYMDSINEDANEELKETYELAMLALANTHQPSDLTWSSEMAVVDLTQDEIGWGGKGRITLIGDAAHSLRPASGLGGSLAFEDAALLGRYISGCNLSSAIAIEEQLRAFEMIRLSRCKSISNDQSIRSNLAYTIGFGRVPRWDPAYAKWINDGINASPDPPVSEKDVFAGLISD